METGSDTDTLNAGLYPSTVGESHEFVVRDLDATETRTVTLTAAEVVAQPVQHVRTLETASGPVGYMLFTTHIAPAEAQLVEAIRQFETDAVTDLVVDLRYNGGGYLDIANQLAFMIAGPAAAGGRTFDELRFNDKHTMFNPVTGEALTPTPFHRTTLGFSDGLAAGEALPTVDLERVYVLTTGDTCSASEAIINGLRGIDIEVIQVGTTTCGKPFGFYPEDNCGTTYFTVQFQSVNAKEFGEYPDGFSPANLGRVEGVDVPGLCGGRRLRPLPRLGRRGDARGGAGASGDSGLSGAVGSPAACRLRSPACGRGRRSRRRPSDRSIPTAWRVDATPRVRTATPFVCAAVRCIMRRVSGNNKGGDL